MKVTDLQGAFSYAMHGCGAYRGILHSNSKEAYQYWGNKVRLFETDVVETEDEQFVLFASHGLTNQELKSVEICNTQPPGFRTKEWLLNQKIYSKSSCGLTVMSLEYVLDEMMKDDNLIFIFDLYGLWKSTSSFAQYLLKLERGRNLLDRIIVEVYYEDQILALKGTVGRLNIMYCVKEMALPYPSNINMETLLNLGVNLISYPWNYINDTNDLKKYVQAGFIIMSLTKTNLKSKRLKNLGVNINNVDIVYTIDNIGYQLPIYLWGRCKRYSERIYGRLKKRIVKI